MNTRQGQTETLRTRPGAELHGNRIVERRLRHLSVSECRFPADRSARRHTHDRPRLMAVLGGSVCEHANGTGHIGAVGSVAVKPAGTWHADHFGRDGLHTLTLEFRPGFGDAIRGNVDSSVFDRVPSYGWSAGGRRFQCLALVAKELRSWDDDSEGIVESAGAELLDHLEGTTVEGDSPSPPWLSRVEDYLQAHFRQAIRVPDLAAEVGVHQTHLHRAFRSRYGCAVGMFVRRLRVQRAASALQAGNKTIAEIALDCGFADQPHLTRLFRAWVGVTPARYRAASRDG